MLKNDSWFAVVNPQSANGSTRKRWPEYLIRLREDGYLIDFAYTTEPGDATRVTQRILKEGYTHIIAVGGDGTMNEVVNGFFSNGQLINSEAELALFSHGTGGDLIRTLQISSLNSIMVANGRYIGGGMMIAPHAELDDGLFDVVCLGDFSTLMLLRHLPKIYKGTHLKIPGVTAAWTIRCHHNCRKGPA